MGGSATSDRLGYGWRALGRGCRPSGDQGEEHQRHQRGTRHLDLLTASLPAMRRRRPLTRSTEKRREWGDLCGWPFGSGAAPASAAGGFDGDDVAAADVEGGLVGEGGLLAVADQGVAAPRPRLAAGEAPGGVAAAL